MLVEEWLVTRVTVDGGMSGEMSVEIVLEENVERLLLEVLDDGAGRDELVDRGIDEVVRRAGLGSTGLL